MNPTRFITTAPIIVLVFAALVVISTTRAGTRPSRPVVIGPRTVAPGPVTYSFRSGHGPVSRFRCSLDRPVLRACRSPYTVTLTAGKHLLRVQALKGAQTSDVTKVRITVSGTPDLGPKVDVAIAAPGAGQVAVGGGAVWVTNGDGSVSRIDPSTNQVVSTVNVGEQNLGIAAVSDTDVWISEPDSDTVDRISVATNTVSARIPLAPGSTPKGAAIAAGSVWVALEHAGAVVRIDPATNAVVKTVAVGSVGANGPLAVAASGGHVWVSVPADGVVARVDPATNTVVAKVHMNQECTIATSQESLWVGGGCGGTTVARVDQAANKTVPLADLGTDVVGGPVAVDRTLWLITFSGKLARIDGDSGAVTRYKPFKGYNVEGESVAAGFGGLWVRAAGKVLRLKT